MSAILVLSHADTGLRAGPLHRAQVPALGALLGPPRPWAVEAADA